MKKNATSAVTSTNSFVQAMKVASNYTRTENGAVTNISTLNDVLDWFGAGGALRTRTDADIVRIFAKAWAQDRLAALKILFYFRDVREGQGERKTFRVLLKWLAERYEDVALKNIENVPFFGRWDDLYILVGTPLEAEVFKYMAAQLRKDVRDMGKGDSVSLLAKWMKSENTSSPESRRLGHKTRSALGFTPKKYRKTLSKLRAYIDVLERKLCAGEWAGVDYEKVPSKASLIYRKAFGKHDHDRYDTYLKSVEKGEKKMNAGVIYPYELIRAVQATEDVQMIKGIDLQWQAMPNWLEGNEHKGLVMADMSGSMFGGTGLAAQVALSLAMYFAERNVGPYKDVFLSFSSSPEFITIRGNNLKEKIRNMILATACKNKVAQKDMPEILYIVSDMEHDNCGSNTNFDAIKEKYKSSGYVLPKLVWWNVNARNENQPIRVDDTGTCLVSGCSPSILKSVLAAKSFNPMDIVFETINSDRYNRVVV